jgi:hypothetical protein
VIHLAAKLTCYRATLPMFLRIKDPQKGAQPGRETRELLQGIDRMQLNIRELPDHEGKARERIANSAGDRREEMDQVFLTCLPGVQIAAVLDLGGDDVLPGLALGGAAQVGHEEVVEGACLRRKIGRLSQVLTRCGILLLPSAKRCSGIST